MIEKHLSLLGLKARDRVTGFEGVVHSVNFDLYGCIQAAVTPPIDKDGKKLDGHWFDISRLTVLDERPVMDVPNFLGTGAIAKGEHGAADKPAGIPSDKRASVP